MFCLLLYLKSLLVFLSRNVLIIGAIYTYVYIYIYIYRLLYIPYTHIPISFSYLVLTSIFILHLFIWRQTTDEILVELIHSTSLKHDPSIRMILLGGNNKKSDEFFLLFDSSLNCNNLGYPTKKIMNQKSFFNPKKKKLMLSQKNLTNKKIHFWSCLKEQILYQKKKNSSLKKLHTSQKFFLFS